MSLDKQEIEFLLCASSHAMTEDMESAQYDHCPEVYDSRKAGWVYVLINPSFPDLVKIGCTKHDPMIRCRELSKPTCCPTPFQIIYVNRFEDHIVAEKTIHEIFKENRVSYKEFFKGLSAIDIHNAFQMARQNEWLTEDMK